MLHEVRASESNPPLYYVLRVGLGRREGFRHRGGWTALADGAVRAATVPVAYLVGRELASRRAGLIAAALVAVNPMLIWYSQEARSYALLVFFGAVSLALLRAGAAHPAGSRDLAFWAPGLVARALQPLLRRLRRRDRGALAADRAARLAGVSCLPAVGAVVAVGLALLPADLRPGHPDPHRLDRRSLVVARSGQTGVASWSAEHRATWWAESPRERYALIPGDLIGVALVLARRARGIGRERARRPDRPLARLGRRRPRPAAALTGKDYIVERNLLPALRPARHGGGDRVRRRMGRAASA